eukprot:15439039-Alexandrium_andersonii.AAC.1
MSEPRENSSWSLSGGATIPRTPPAGASGASGLSGGLPPLLTPPKSASGAPEAPVGVVRGAAA